MVYLAALLSIAFSPASGDAPAVLDFTTSSSRPFVGQEVDLTVTIRIADALAEEVISGRINAHLEIPWLNAELVEWSLPAEQWVCRHSLSRAGLSVRLNAYPVRVRLQPVETFGGQRAFRLQWRGRVRDSSADAERDITFEPPRLEIADQTATGKPLTLSVRALPPAVPTDVYLGVGDFHMEASVKPGRIILGEETAYTLTIAGAGSLGAVARPDLASLESFRRSFLIENGSETWNADRTSRSFRYLLKPRKSIGVVPAILYSCFDPNLGTYQTRTTAALPLTVRAKELEPVPPYPPGVVPDRLQLVPGNSKLLREEQLWPQPIVLASVLMVPPLACVIVWLLRRRLFPVRWGLPGRAWSGLAAETLAKANRAVKHSRRLAAEQVDHAIMAYLQERFQLQLAEPSAQQLRDHLERAGVAPVAIDSVLQLRRECEAARFAPANQPPADELRSRVADALRALEDSP